MKENAVKDKSFASAIQTVKLYKYLIDEKREFVLSKQLLRFGAAIGALTREAEHAESKADFIHKLSISLKEADETDYWIELLFQTGFLLENEYKAINKDVEELIRLLVAIIKISKARK